MNYLKFVAVCQKNCRYWLLVHLNAFTFSNNDHMMFQIPKPWKKINTYFFITPQYVMSSKFLKMKDLKGARRKQEEKINYYKCNRYFFVVIQEENIDKLRYFFSYRATSGSFKALSKSCINMKICFCCVTLSSSLPLGCMEEFISAAEGL